MRSAPLSVTDPIGANDHNVNGTLHVLNAARRAGVRRVVYASSSAVYGNDPTLPKTEEVPLTPISPYAVSKAADAMYAQVWTRLYDLETVGLRYFNVFGPRQDPASEYAAVIPRFILWALRGEPLEVHGDRQRRGGEPSSRVGAGGLGRGAQRGVRRAREPAGDHCPFGEDARPRAAAASHARPRR